jgi:hypothetical protein
MREKHRDPVAEKIPRVIRSPGKRRAWLEAARGARRAASLVRSFATKNTRHLYEAWARSLEGEAAEILEKVRLYSGKPAAAPHHFTAKGASLAPVIAGENE